MAVERLREALRFDLGNRFFVLYGMGIQDAFITQDYVEYDIESALWQLLKQQGFERILFYSTHRGMDFLDASSRDLSRPQEGERFRAQPGGGPGPTMRRFSEGPLGNRMLPKAQQRPGPASPPQGRGDVYSIDLLNTVMRDEHGPKSAVVVVQAETTLRFFEDPRTLAGWVGEWARLPSTNANVCLFLFATDQYPELCETVKRLPVPELSTYLAGRQPEQNKGCSVIRIGGPDATEMARLIDYARLRDGVQVNWQERPQLTTWMATEGKRAKAWLQQLRDVRRLDRATARQQRWLASMPTDQRSAQERLEALTGLRLVKDHLAQQEAFLAEEARRRQAGLGGRGEPLSLHMVFTGNPGTGKTTVARLIGELYRDLGLLQRGHLVETKVSDLVAEHIGGTTIKTNGVIDQALDGVLFIDEAYQLTEPERGGFGREAMDALLIRMENDRDRLVVVVAGYPEKMKEFLQANPGLPRRFPEENVLHFPDYTPEELMIILRRMLQDRGFAWTPEMEERLHEVVDGLHATRNETFGNAGEIRNFTDALGRRRAVRVQQQSLPVDEPLRPDDIPARYQQFLRPPVPEIEELLKELTALVGLQPVKDFVRRQVRTMQMEQHRRQQGHTPRPRSLHMVFTGNPGTGKTTVARLMGRIFKALGMVRKGHVVETSRADLVAGYIGQTAPKTTAKIKEALDGVLFIDEAHALARGGAEDFGQEAINALNKCMEDYRDRLVVIVAGYPEEMRRFIESDSGLNSRFPQPVEFPDYTRDELLGILRRMAREEAYALSPAAEAQALAYLQALRRGNQRGFGNGRAVRNLFEEMIGRHAERILERGGEVESDLLMLTFEGEDVPPLPGVPLPEPAHPAHRAVDLVSLLLPPPPEPLSLERIRQAVGYVAVQTNTGERGSGTGFVVTPQGHFLTAYHVVEQAATIQVSLEANRAQAVPAELVGWDVAADLAVLRLAESPYPWIPLAEPGYTPRIGEDVGVLSYPLGEELGLEITYTAGPVGSLRRNEHGAALLQVSAAVTHGSSGGPLFRLADYRVIGIVHGGVKHDIASGLNFAVSVEEIYRRFASEV